MSARLAYSIEVTAIAAGSYEISVPAGAFQDAAGNRNLVGATLVILVGEVSSQPAVELHAGSNTGFTRDRVTSDNTPDFTVSNVAANALVRVSATRGSGATAVTVTRQVRVGAGATTARAPFAGNACDRNGDSAYRESCTLGDGASGRVTATHIDGSKLAAGSNSIAVTIDTVAPQFTAVTPAAVSLAVGGSATVLLDVSEAVFSFRSSSFQVTPAGVVTLSSPDEAGNGFFAADRSFRLQLTGAQVGTAENSAAGQCHHRPGGQLHAGNGCGLGHRIGVGGHADHH